MTEWLVSLVPVHGPWILALATFGACLPLPIPSALLVLAAGGLVATGDLDGVTTAAAVMAGLIAGDQTGYQIGRRGGAGLVDRLGARSPRVAGARDLLSRHGGLAVFLSRWFLSPLGPYVTLAAGAVRLNWISFTLWDIAGGAIWVALYLGLGFVFADNLATAAELAGTAAGWALGATIVAGLAAWAIYALRARHRR